MLSPADVLEFKLAGGNKVIVRPSGTEPKTKGYLFARAADAACADKLLAKTENAVREMLV